MFVTNIKVGGEPTDAVKTRIPLWTTVEIWKKDLLPL